MGFPVVVIGGKEVQLNDGDYIILKSMGGYVAAVGTKNGVWRQECRAGSADPTAEGEQDENGEQVMRDWCENKINTQKAA